MKLVPLYAICLLAMPLGAAEKPAESPWFGTWKLRLKDPAGKPETLVYSDAGGGAMRMVSVEQDSIIVTRFDGEPSPDFGRKGNPAPVLAVKATSSTSYDWTYFQGGKPFVRGTNTLSADRRSFREVSWLITTPDTTVTLIYDRQ